MARARKLGMWRWGVAVLATLGVAVPAAALDSESLFEKYEKSIVQVRIVEASSGAKRAIGTGFVVGATGELATNYHVISDLVWEPKSYRAEWVDEDEEAHVLELLAFDAVRDIALLRADEPFGTPLVLHRGEPRNGERVYALGDPYDLGLSIVEGLYNGQLEHAFYDRIHFTGSLNPGMSGGPAMLSSGEVVGVNVASMGDQVSFLVPVAELRRLIGTATTGEPAAPEERKKQLRDQLWQHQNEYFGRILESEGESVQLGGYSAPSRIAPFFNCWGDVIEGDELLHRGLTHNCSTQDWIYLGKGHQIGVIWLSHRQLSSEELSRSRFYTLYSAFFENNWSRLNGSKEIFTEFVCRTRFVEESGMVFKTAFCARRYLDFDGLFDVVFKAAHVGEGKIGFETAIVMTAVSLDNAAKVARRHLRDVQWSD